MVRVTDDELLAHAERINGKVLLITGGSTGLGKQTALLYAQYGAKVVIGDVNMKGAEEVVQEIISSGGSAIAQACNVTIWDDQVALFDLAMKTYGCVDVVIANAGVMDTPWLPIKQEDGQLAPPRLTTLDINVTGVLYTCSLAMHYLVPDPEALTPESVKALVLVGSVASFKPVYGGVQYTASKHAVLGMQRAIGPVCTSKGIRSGSVNPGFVDTPLVKVVREKGLLTGFPLVPIERVAATCLAVAADTDPKTSERPWLLLDGIDVERLHDFDLDEGLYKELNNRTRGSLRPAKPFAAPPKPQ